MSPQLFFSIVVRLTQSQLQSWILSYERGNANHSKGRVITVPLRHPWPLRIIINEQFCQKKLKGPECGVVMSVMTGVRWSKDKGLLTVTPPGSQSTLLACNFKTGTSASKKIKCYRYHSLYKCTQPASESNWWVCGGSPQRKKTVKTAAWVWAGERRKEWSWSKCCLTISREPNGKPSAMLNLRKHGAMWPEGLFKVLEESFRSLALMYLGCELAHTKPGVCCVN